MAEQTAISELDKRIIRILQRDFPLVAEPYKQMAEEAGVSVDDFVARVQAMCEERKIRKMGAVLRHREVGFKANVLAAWEVPAERLDAIAREMAKCPRVSHCYDRTTAPGWPYNLYTMIHGQSRKECEAIAVDLAEKTGASKPVMLYTKKEWKKTSMRYFME
ncbi:MAG: AsnC family transcriptional regulator [Mitsuokella sp.]